MPLSIKHATERDEYCLSWIGTLDPRNFKLLQTNTLDHTCPGIGINQYMCWKVYRDRTVSHLVFRHFRKSVKSDY